MKPLDTNEVVVVVALGEDGSGARLLSRMMRKSWGELGLAEGDERLRPGQGGRARAGARRVGVMRAALHTFLRLDLAKVSKATASTMMTPMMICWM